MSESAPDGEVPVAFQDPVYRAAMVDLLGVIAYGEISAFERLAEDAKLAPSLEDKVALAAMASAEFGKVEPLHRRITELGADPFAAMKPFRAAIDQFHLHTAPCRLARGPGQGLRRRRARQRLLPRDRGLPRPRHPRPGRLLRRGREPGGVPDRAGAADHRHRPRHRRPAGPVGPPAHGRGAHPGATGRRRARVPHRPPRRRRRPPRPRPGRASAGCSPGSPSGTPSGWPSSGSTADRCRRVSASSRDDAGRCGRLGEVRWSSRARR